MALSKTKALEEAAKLVSQRKIPQAIKHYLVIAEQDPQDLPLLNTIGDLCVRDGNIPEALRQFHRLADAYTREGFTLKAIAIYKKIVKLDSHSVDPILKLADLYAGQKLSHEANEQYKQALALCQRNSLHDKAGQILRKLVAQDPANATYRARLAEFFQSAGEPEEALRGYLEAAAISYRHKDLGAADASLRRAAEIAPRNTEVLLGQVRLAAEAGQVDEVNRILEGTPEIRSNLEGRMLLLRAYLGSGRVNDAAMLAIDAYRKSPEGWEPVSIFATHRLEAGNPDAALSVLGEVAGLAFERAQSNEFTALLQKSLEARPHCTSSLEPIWDLCESQRQQVIPSGVIEALGQAFAATGQWAKAEAVFQRLCALDDHRLEWKSLLNESRERQLVEREPVSAQPPPVLTEPAPLPPTDRENLPPLNLDSSGPPGTSPQPTVLEPDLSTELESFGAAPPAPDLASPPAPALPPEPEAPSEAAIVSPPLEPTGAEAVVAPEPSPVLQPESAPLPSDLGEERTEVEFYLDYGFLAEGVAALDKLSSKYPGHPQVEALRDRLAGKLAARNAEPESSAAPLAAEGKGPSVEPVAPVVEPAGDDLACAQAVIPDAAMGTSEALPHAEAGQPAPDSAGEGEGREPAEEVAASPTRLPSDAWMPGGLAQAFEHSWDESEESREADHDPQPASPHEPWTRGKSALDELARDLEMTLGESDGSEGPAPAAVTCGLDSSPSLFDSSLEELLSELSAGEEPAPADDTPQTHYNLGVAFREMGLVDEAIGEFQKVVKGTAGVDSAPKLLEACSLLGICFMEKQMPGIAVRWLTRALRSPGLNEETTMALTYDLAAAYEQSGDAKIALEKFYEVYSQNIDYRDVAEKIHSLDSKRA